MFYFRSISVLVFLAWVLDICIPRFISEEVAFALVEEGEGEDFDAYVPICSLKDITDEDDDVVMVGTMRSFNLFGFALLPKLIGELRPYNPYEKMDS
ncbi:hypothetical protein HOS86_gp069 [Klebsiella phage vB_KpnM_KpS110]|uniref:Uncharacterized protein n=1 Tax=Klebsiella phage vB_KpnM_KpS110 TaxID=2079262 RepID=A0A2K9VAF6_9CAUD|nr:hypothetical protein HOS86_gp069 [Klebsiella phage vB_KpnM_KpS110]AUV59185.1 hypothetical protein kps110_069 [Klebsiella phage vB_KpnM_KpS110]